jgi:hypothetical protein
MIGKPKIAVNPSLKKVTEKYQNPVVRTTVKPLIAYTGLYSQYVKLNKII